MNALGQIVTAPIHLPLMLLWKLTAPPLFSLLMMATAPRRRLGERFLEFLSLRVSRWSISSPQWTLNSRDVSRQGYCEWGTSRLSAFLLLFILHIIILCTGPMVLSLVHSGANYGRVSFLSPPLILLDSNPWLIAYKSWVLVVTPITSWLSMVIYVPARGSIISFVNDLVFALISGIMRCGWKRLLQGHTRLVVTQVWIKKNCNKKREMGFYKAV